MEGAHESMVRGDPDLATAAAPPRLRECQRCAHLLGGERLDH